MKTEEAKLAGTAIKILPAVCIMLATWLLLWLSQGLAGVCALAYQCHAPDVRLAPALLLGGLMLVPTVALILTARNGRSWTGVRILSYIVLVGLAVVGLGAVLFSGGFTIPPRF